MPREPDRDTPCHHCGKWLHYLTPGGRGVMFCTSDPCSDAEKAYRKALGIPVKADTGFDALLSMLTARPLPSRLVE